MFNTLLEAISKMSFDPISALDARFQSSKYFKYSSGWNLAAALTLNQNPIFEKSLKRKNREIRV